MRRLLAVLAVATAGLGVGARADHIEAHLGPSEPARAFPADFLPLLPADAQARTTLTRWNDERVGGWGGAACDRPVRRPVVFVHGNSEDAWFWRAGPSGDGTIVDVRAAFLAAGYCERELWAITYSGSRGYFTFNDVNAEEAYAFLAAVRTYTGAAKIDVVSHSLGVTVVRKAMSMFPRSHAWVAHHVAIAGANHGSTTCRGVGSARGSHVCEELEPGSQWLAELNGTDETPPGPRFLTILDGSGAADQFYLGPDALSPELAGACNLRIPLTPHNTLARGATATQRYIAFLRDDASCAAVGGAGEEISSKPAPKPRPVVEGRRTLPATGVGEAAFAPLLLALAAFLAGRRRGAA